MALSADQIAAAMAELVRLEPGFARGLARAGMPPPRVRAPGYETLLRTILGQQVSVASAESIWRKLAGIVERTDDPALLAALGDDALRGAGFSRQKIGYARSLAEEVLSGRLDLADLPADDEEAIAALVRIKGIGRWSAEIYLLFAEGRADIWPAGDLAVQIEIGHLLDMEERPSERAVRALAEGWRPHRGALAIFAWHHYGHRLSAGKKAFSAL